MFFPVLELKVGTASQIFSSRAEPVQHMYGQAEVP